MNNIVQFYEQELKLVSYENQLWFSSVDIAKALNFSKDNAVTKIYNNHKSEFTNEMTCLPKSGKQRIFNREGAWLIGMFARTPKAAEFRKWVLKVLGAVVDGKVDNKQVVVAEHTRALPSGKKEIVLSAKAREEIGGITKAVVGKALEGCKVIEYINPLKNILSDDLLTENYMTPMEIENHIGHLLTGLWDYKKSSADMYKLYRLLEACKALACRYHSYANHLQGGVDFCEYYRGKNAKYFELNTDALYATVRGMLDTKIELSAL